MTAQQTQVSPEILTQAKNEKKAPTKVMVFLNTYRYVKSGGSIKSWGPPAYLGYFGPLRSKIGPKGQNPNKWPREANKVTFPIGLSPWVRIFQKNWNFSLEDQNRPKWMNLDQNWTQKAQTLLTGLERQTQWHFLIIWSPEFEFSMKNLNFFFKVTK